LRWQRWALSDLNPWLWSLPAMSSFVKETRCAAPPENPYRRVEKAASDMIIAGLDLFRDLRDTMLESFFFQIYGPPAIFGVVATTTAEVTPRATDPRDLPIVQEALATIGQGGYPEAMALIGALIGRGAGHISLARLELVDRFVRTDAVLSQLSADEVRRIKAQQAVIAELEPERGLQSLTKLLVDPADRQRALDVLDEAVVLVELTDEQKRMLDRVLGALGAETALAPNLRSDVAPREFAEVT
jgi:hypothetical protein